MQNPQSLARAEKIPMTIPLSTKARPSTAQGKRLSQSLFARFKNPVNINSTPPVASHVHRVYGVLNASLEASTIEVFGAVRAGRFAYLTEEVERVTGNPPRTFEAWCREHVATFQ